MKDGWNRSDEYDRLGLALLELEGRDQFVACQITAHGELWISESPEDRALAIDLCDGCPVTDLCRSAAEASGSDWGVWGAVEFSDRHPEARNRRREGERRRARRQRRTEPERNTK